MNEKIRHINNKHSRNGFESDMMADNADSALFESIGEYMKGRLDLEEVKNDPALSTTMEAVKDMISDYNKNLSENRENEKFISESFSKEETEETITDEIKFIKKEIADNKLNEITSEWVKEWHKKKQKTGVSDPKTEKRRDFILSSINSEESKSIKIRPPFVRYVSLSAAALIGAFLLIRTLLPSSNPEKLFDSYYKPFNAVSPVTRSINNNETDSYSSAIESYKSANYQQAAIGFASLVQKDPSVVSTQFFLGLSQLELKNYDQAINLLAGVANGSGEYGKEARWYLGLSYLKTGNRQKAAECYEFLARSDGFYRERSEKILRRLR